MTRYCKMSDWITFVAIALLSLLVACQSNTTGGATIEATPKPALPTPQTTISKPAAASKTTDAAQLVDIGSINARIRLDLRYATANNFMHQKLYNQSRCLLRSSVAAQLAQVQTELEASGLRLKVYDCYRPLSVQKLMWKLVPDDRYVANPAQGSRHNRGSAVDLTLVDRAGKELIMPTEFDDFTDRAARDYSGASAEAKQNRQRLEDVMQKHGFTPLLTEWWHFDAVQWAQFPLLDVPLENVPYSSKH